MTRACTFPPEIQPRQLGVTFHLQRFQKMVEKSAKPSQSPCWESNDLESGLLEGQEMFATIHLMCLKQKEE